MAKEIEHVTEDGEVITLPATMEQQTSLAIGLSRAEIDQQVSTAHAYPRSVNRAVQNILSLVTMDEKSAEECTYALPRGGKPIMGPSVRMAEIIAGQWGNNRVGARVVHVDRAEKYVEAEGIFHDLETNAATTARVRRRIVDKHGRLYNDDMIIVTGNAASAIAKRNAILGGVPKAVWRKAYDAAQATVKGDVKTLSERREGALKAFAAYGVKPEQVFAAINVSGIDDITLDHIPTLIGMHSAIKSGEETVETMFGNASRAADGGEKKNTRDKMKDLAEGKGKADGKKQNEAGADKPKAEQSDKASGDKGKAEQGKPADTDDDFPGDKPSKMQADRPASDEAEATPSTSEDIEAARDRGHDAYHKGMRREMSPKEFNAKGREPERDAWLEAFDTAHAEDQDNG